MRPLLFHLPLIGSLLIAGAISAIEAGVVPALRTERTFGWRGGLTGRWFWLILPR